MKIIQPYKKCNYFLVNIVLCISSFEKYGLEVKENVEPEQKNNFGRRSPRPLASTNAFSRLFCGALTIILKLESMMALDSEEPVLLVAKSSFQPLEPVFMNLLSRSFGQKV
jgi:hypothetical protein